MDLYETDRDTLEDVLYRRLKCSGNLSLTSSRFSKSTMPLSHAVHRRSGTVIDAVDEDKELTFALIQDHCAREICRTTRDPDRHGPARGDARRFVRPQTCTPTRAADPRRQDFSSDLPGDISAFLCNILEANNVQPKRVLRARNLPTHDLQDGHALDALFQAALPFMPETVASDTDAKNSVP
jgi:hypothetical protein